MVEEFKNQYRNVRERANHYLLAYKWKWRGKIGPPPHLIKEKVIKEYASKFSAQTLVETGTYLGEMVYAMRRRFSKIISIELDSTLHQRATERFKAYHHVTILCGDSGAVLARVLSEEKSRCLFWLDGHYSGEMTAKGSRETPVMEELKHIKSSGSGHVILIDDARLFVGANDYPTLAELKSFVNALLPTNVFEVRDDIIRIHPPD
jgi:hypothetical protein